MPFFFALSTSHDGLVGNAVNKRTRLDELTEVTYLESPRPIERFCPVAVSVVNLFFPFAPELPNTMVAIRYAAGSGKNRTIGLFANIVVVEISTLGVPRWPGIYRM